MASPSSSSRGRTAGGIFLVLGLLAGGAAWWLHDARSPIDAPVPPPPATPVGQPPIAPSPSPQRRQAVTAAPAGRFVAPAARPAHPGETAAQGLRRIFSEKPEGNLVPFRVVDGYAIAYGDVLLGKPDPSFQDPVGFFDAPTPQLWETPEIPYVINSDIPNPERIHRAIRYLAEHTPVRFVPLQAGHRDAIVFERGSEHCFSALGRVGGLQAIRLSASCGWTEILHEMMHSLGFIHEQSRMDRENFIEILWDNIEEQYQVQFAYAPESFQEPVRNSPFDYRSVMLYDPTAFAKQPGLPAMRSTTQDMIAPVKEGLSTSDLARLRQLYDPYEKR